MKKKDLKIGILNCPNTLNYSSMIMWENFIFYFSKFLDNPHFIIIYNNKEETLKRTKTENSYV